MSLSVVHDLDDALCEYNCCSGNPALCPDYATSKCGGEFGRVSLYNLMAAPVTIGLQAFLTDKDGANVIIQYGGSSIEGRKSDFVFTFLCFLRALQ